MKSTFLAVWFLALFVFVSYAAIPLPSFFPITRGAVAEKVEALAKTDMLLAEMDQRLVDTDTEIKNLLSTDQDMAGRLRMLEALIGIEAQDAKANIEHTRGEYRAAQSWSAAMDATGAALGNIFKAVTTGDPTAMFAVGSMVLTVVASAYGKNQKGKAREHERNAAEKDRAAKMYASMGAESAEYIKKDPLFPDVT